MIKEKIKTVAMAITAGLLSVGVLGSVAFAAISMRKREEAENAEKTKLKADYVQKVDTYASPVYGGFESNNYAAGKDNWKVRMNESAFKFGQNGYVVFSADDTYPAELGQQWYSALAVYSNLYSEFPKRLPSYWSYEDTKNRGFTLTPESLYVKGFYPSFVSGNKNGWTSIYGADSVNIAPAKTLNCPISRWALSASLVSYRSGLKTLGNELSDINGFQMNCAPVIFGYSSADGNYGQTSIIIDKSVANDMYFTAYVNCGTKTSLSTFRETAGFVSIYGYNGETQPNFINPNLSFTTDSYIEDLAQFYGKDNYLCSANLQNSDANGSYVTFRLSGVGRFQIVAGRSAQVQPYVQFGGFFLDTIK